MMLTRRRLIVSGGLIVLGAPTVALPSKDAAPIDITMDGAPGGAHVWFRPAGLLILPGQTVRWTNLEKGNVHTTTAYHPDNKGKPQRIPMDAPAWDSGYLMPGQSFSVTFTIPGVYDYYCIPHEMAGMVGRIIVGESHAGEWKDSPETAEGLPLKALENFPGIERILQEKRVEL